MLEGVDAYTRLAEQGQHHLGPIAIGDDADIAGPGPGWPCVRAHDVRGILDAGEVG